MSDGANVRVERIPFTIYDVIAYLGPGIVSAWAIFDVVPSLFNAPNDSVARFVHDRSAIFGVAAIDIAVAIVVAGVFAYTLGVLIGFIASVTIEKLSIVYFGYPSEFVRTRYKFAGPIADRDITKKFLANGCASGAILVQLICLPLTIFIWGANILALFSVVIKPLPETMILSWEERFQFLSGYKIGYERRVDWFRFVCFYVINNNPVAFLRMYNYLTLYGFLRNMTFIFLVSTWVYSSAAIVFCGTERGCTFAISALASGIVCGGLFCGFLKFYRRYTEEAILAFALMRIDPDVDEAVHQARKAH